MNHKRMSELAKLHDSVEIKGNGWYNWLTRSTPEWFIDVLSTYGTIAGGSVLACFTDLKVNDIDVFMDNLEDYQKALSHISKNLEVVKYSNIGSVLQIDVANNMPHIQLIMVQDSEPQTLLSRFDMDYIRAAFYDGEFHLMPEFKEALETKQITKYKPIISKKRLQKTLDKGFKLPEELKTLMDVLPDDSNCGPVYKEITLEQAESLPFKPLIRSTDYSNDDKIEFRVISHDVKPPNGLKMPRGFTVTEYSIAAFQSESDTPLIKLKSINVKIIPSRFHVDHGHTTYGTMGVIFRENPLLDLIKERVEISNVVKYFKKDETQYQFNNIYTVPMRFRLWNDGYNREGKVKGTILCNDHAFEPLNLDEEILDSIEAGTINVSTINKIENEECQEELNNRIYKNFGRIKPLYFDEFIKFKMNVRPVKYFDDKDTNNLVVEFPETPLTKYINENVAPIRDVAKTHVDFKNHLSEMRTVQVAFRLYEVTHKNYIKMMKDGKKPHNDKNEYVRLVILEDQTVDQDFNEEGEVHYDVDEDGGVDESIEC